MLKVVMQLGQQKMGQGMIGYQLLARGSILDCRREEVQAGHGSGQGIPRVGRFRITVQCRGYTGLAQDRFQHVAQRAKPHRFPRRRGRNRIR